MSMMGVAFGAVLATVSIYRDGWIDFNKNGRKDVYEDRTRPVAERVADLVGQMTVDEKICQLVTLYGSGRVLKDVQPTPEWKKRVWKDGIANIDEELNGVGSCFKRNYDLIYPFSNHIAAIRNIQRWFVEETRLGIPVDFSNEGIHGLNHTKATPLPAPIGIGTTWNRALVREAGEIVGEEAKLIGYSNVYAPILDVARDPRWGRVLECYGEDPYLVGALGTEMSAGIQSKGVGSTLKHYAAYSVPKGGRDGNCRTDPHITPRELHEIFLRPFAAVVRAAHPMGVMCSYNDWNGEPVASSHWFLTDLLRGEYGFDGYVVSDSEAVEFVHTKHAVAETPADAARMVLEAGLNVRTHFTPPEDFAKLVRAEYDAGKLAESVIDARVAEVLSVKFRLGLFDNPYLGDAERADRLAGMARHLDFVDRMHAEAMVLLKNEKDALPLVRGTVGKILVVGPLADETDFMISRYGPNGLEPVSLLKGLRDYVGTSAEVAYEKGCELVDKGWPETELYRGAMTPDEAAAMDAAVRAAGAADVVIAVLGEGVQQTGESRSRTSLDLPGRQQELLERLVATGKKVVLVLVNGQPLTVNFAAAKVPAILEAWWPSVRGGVAVAKALFGETNPSGKLTVTFPKAVGQLEYNFPYKKGSHASQPKWAQDPNGYGLTRVEGALYPFGHGLSYTTFAYASLEVAETADGVRVACDVTNTGRRAGAEVVQLYVSDRCSSVVAYESVLRGFEKVALKPGETRRVVFDVPRDDLRIMGREMKWVFEPGEFEFRVGSSSEDIRLRRSVRLGEGPAAEPASEGWRELFNGRDLTGWTPKIRGFAAGVNAGNTFFVKDGLLCVGYADQLYAEGFKERFGHLFYDVPFTNYVLRATYRMLGHQLKGGPDWAERNNGIMLHGQSPASMAIDQDFPVSVELQLLSGLKDGKPRTTANLCTPGTNVERDGKLYEPHVLNSVSATHAAGDWTTVEAEVHGGEEMIFRVWENGAFREVLRFRHPQYDPKASCILPPEAVAPLVRANGGKLVIPGGTISIQSESAPTQYRSIRIRPLAR